jgi:hypothetical protein
MDSPPSAGSWWGGQRLGSSIHLCVFAPFNTVGVVPKSAISICLPIHPSACINSAPTLQIFITFKTVEFYNDMSRKYKLGVKIEEKYQASVFVLFRTV